MFLISDDILDSDLLSKKEKEKKIRILFLSVTWSKKTVFYCILRLLQDIRKWDSFLENYFWKIIHFQKNINGEINGAKKKKKKGRPQLKYECGWKKKD